MGWWSKKKKQTHPVVDALGMDDLAYAVFVADLVDNMDPGTRAHTVVAYQNLIPILSAFHTLHRKRDEEYTVEQFIEMTALNTDKSDEFTNRRISWFLFSALIARLEKIARRDDRIIPIAASIWTILTTEYPRLKFTLPENIVWTNKEKIWFDLSNSDDELMQLAINHHIPPVFSSHHIVEQFARSLGLFYWPSKTRIGFVP